jgi:hypothetical protein
MAICSLDFMHRLYVLQPQHFEGWLFPRHQVVIQRHRQKTFTDELSHYVSIIIGGSQ